MKITREKLREWDACYTDEHIAELVPADGLDMLEILALPISDRDRIWVATRPGALPRPVWLEWLARMVERALARIPKPDPRSVAVVAALRSDSVSPEMLRASAAAAAAEAERAAAAAAAWEAASEAAWEAASEAAAAAERESQISDLRNLLEQYEAKN